jgi:adenylate kinase
MRISVIGPPGSGKTTQAKILAQKLSLPHVYMGGVLREAIERGTGLDGQLRKALEEGELVDDDLVLKLFFKRIEREDCRAGIISDGTPRTLYQARKVEERSPLDKAIFVKTSLAKAKERLLERGRADDTEETITHRFQVFTKQTKPILDFYREKGKLVEVDGNKTVEEVTKEIETKLRDD